MLYNFQPTPKIDVWGNMREIQVWESSQLFGRPVKYLKPTIIKDNKIFGEVVSRDFIQANAFDMFAFRDDDTHFAGGESFGGFGFLPQYNDLVRIPVKWFSDLSIEPIEGDLIYYVNEDVLMEVTKVTPKNEAFAGDIVNERLFNHRLYLKLYNMADDSFSGLTDVSLENLSDLDDPSMLDMNEDMEEVIESLDIVRPVSPQNPFGVLG